MKRMFAVAIALSMLAAPAVAAPNNQTYGGQPHNGQTPHPQNQGPQNHGSQQAPKPQAPQPQAQTKPAPKPQYSYNGRKYDAVRGPAWKAPKGYDAHRSWSRGQKMPQSFYRDRAYVIDYRAYHLKQPPRGYVWVRADRNVYLVSQQSGLISQIVLNLFYY
ncbi:RcnB family protein [Parvibaculum sp.]|uniref:RcnB family protein n=1 Tax=Parvibaculum sp. TaxID=2024848 RepID=UPI002BA5FDF4|nr:RcnB family protein [Parvibaculum sp.]HUD53223.1 RcnB family protein [Parvibaculum sp.]